jgi:plastocyanin
MRFRKMILLAALGVVALAAALPLAGCGTSSADNPSDNTASQSAGTDSADKAASGAATQSTAAAGSVALAADPNGDLKYDKTSLDASAGNVEIKFTNDSSTPHNVTVQDSSGKQEGATDDVTGGKATLKLSGLKAGTYTYFCSIPGHEQAGMKGTLTVK